MEKESNNPILEIIRFAVITLIIVVPIRAYVAQPFVVSGASMFPTFESGQYLIIDEFSFHFRTPERGEVVVFRFPQDPRKFFIKRVIGLPGETVTVNDGLVTIEGKDGSEIELNEPYVSESAPFRDARTVLGEGEYFVMGDNRPASSDSRVWGAVEEDLIEGRVLLRLFPVKEFGVTPGEFNNI